MADPYHPPKERRAPEPPFPRGGGSGTSGVGRAQARLDQTSPPAALPWALGRAGMATAECPQYPYVRRGRGSGEHRCPLSRQEGENGQGMGLPTVGKLYLL